MDREKPSDPRPIAGVARLDVPSPWMHAQLRLKHNLAASILEAAGAFAIEARQLELEALAASVGAPERHRPSVLASVVLAAAFLEGAINETFLQAVDGNLTVFADYSNADLELLSAFWHVLEEHRAPTLRKCQVALAAVRKAPFDKGAEPHQAAAALFGLRDAIMHFKPEWDTDLAAHADLEGSLRGRFETNPFASAGSLFFPHRALGAGCARWACLVAMDFVDDFARRLAIRSPLTVTIERVRPRVGA